MPTALYVERDPSYLLVRRRLLGTMTRAEWDSPAQRQAALERWWARAKQAIRVEDEEFVTECPVVLYRHPIDGTVHYADIREQPHHPPKLITPTGAPLPRTPASNGLVRHNTSYRSWAEGPLPHIEPDMVAAPTPLDDPIVQTIRAQNSALRELIDGALGPANYAAMPRLTPTTEHQVDFCLRGVFRRRDYRVLRSLQDAALGSKIITSEGVIE